MGILPTSPRIKPTLAGKFTAKTPRPPRRWEIGHGGPKIFGEHTLEAIIPPSTAWAEIVQVPVSDATLIALPTGAVISLRVLSANPAGYAQPSEEINATVP